MTIKRMTDLDLAGKRVLIREDLNVPVKNGEVSSDARIRASLPTIKAAKDAGAKVMLMSHLGRPEEGVYDEASSMKPVADHLSKVLGQEVRLITDYLEGVDVADGEVVLFENVRFNKGEKKDDEELSKKYAALCDVYVMDAFGTAHRAHGSTEGVTKFLSPSVAGFLLQKELDYLEGAVKVPARPFAAIVGG
ncbi:phosphoglycerate kinase, partial [Marinobacter sp.]|uniref:phosphoglycerate kinase n=1 Tax=Marinobacter sp. TaxID=50741 RepID=UPI003298D09D